MDLNAFWVLAGRPASSGQDRRLEQPAALPCAASARAAGDLESVVDSRGLRVLQSPEPAGPRLGALFGKVA